MSIWGKGDMPHWNWHSTVNGKQWVNACNQSNYCSSTATDAWLCSTWSPAVAVLQLVFRIYSGSLSSSNLLRSGHLPSGSYQFLPLFPVLSCSSECHILYFHQVTQQVHSFPTSCSLPQSFFRWLYHAVKIHVLAHALTTHLHFLTVSSIFRTTSKILSTLLWYTVYLFHKLHENPPTTFRVILLTDKQGWKRYSLLLPTSCGGNK